MSDAVVLALIAGVPGAIGAVFAGLAMLRAGRAEQLSAEGNTVAAATKVQVDALEKNTNSITARLQVEARAAGRAEGAASAGPSPADVTLVALELAEAKAREILARAVVDAERLRAVERQERGGTS